MKRVVLHTGTTSEVKTATRDDHLFVPLADLQAWALRHKATVDGMDHDVGCAGRKVVSNRSGTLIVGYDDNDCNCPRGDALREIEEIIGCSK